MSDKTPESTSSDYDAMAPYWSMMDAILGDVPTMRAGGETYLPRFAYESEKSYQIRLKNARFTNIFGDIAETLASKPFEKEVTITGADALKDVIENIDGQGNHLHVFSGSVFYDGITKAISWVLVDYTRDVPAGATVAQERELGARPYWLHIPANQILAVYSEVIGGVETIVHARIAEAHKVRDGYGEAISKRVRVLNREVTYDDKGEALSAGPATWELFEERIDRNGRKEWVSLATAAPYSIGVIPLVPFITGKRLGSSWVIRPALQSAAHLQVEHYQQENESKYARQQTAFPMLAGNGVEPDCGDDGNPKPVPVGPMAVLYAAPNGEGDHGEWAFIEPEGTSLDYLSSELERTERQLRELGRQPLTAQSGNITTITAAFAGDKAHTVIEAWALNFKDFLENCLKLTAQWKNLTIEPEVDVNTDFALSLREDDGSDSLEKARDRGDLSQETYWAELKRRGKLSPNFDAETERERIIKELPGGGDEV